MSYRLDSDIFVPYSRLKSSPKPRDQTMVNHIAKTKNGTAVWVVSNCGARYKRMEYVREMQKYIDIDIYGKCGTPCAWKNTTCNDWTTKYKFYLAFENSLCTDYVTEKFFRLFNRTIFVIPVVRGGADYDKHFPDFTYINSAHFKTAKDLALHLKHLASDLENYSKYLEYKDLYTLLADDGIADKMACQICNYLHTHQLPKPSQTYNITKYFVDGQCHIP
ncbi:unnamed protein product [Candidula unifasciata]|uniref:Fucosyltransferase n=1 Tax=Candidula unifasciata TaxID=100452 RepID=A0A8S3ZEL8_9EUPU|nr:unnamed protein product [Candidula unifasciata]